MEPFDRLDAVALPIARPTSTPTRSSPARYLQKPRADDFGDYLFRDLRFARTARRSRASCSTAARTATRASSSPSATSAAARSREHAVWALYDYGIRAVIAPSFGDIFDVERAEERPAADRAARRGRRRSVARAARAQPGRARRRRPRRADRHARPTAPSIAFDDRPVRQALPARGPGRDRATR